MYMSAHIFARIYQYVDLFTNNIKNIKINKSSSRLVDKQTEYTIHSYCLIFLLHPIVVHLHIHGQVEPLTKVPPVDRSR